MELLDICNEEGFPTGETVERERAHSDVFCVNPTGMKVLVDYLTKG